tara:strand:+ start:3210 stop:3338 length:129 start_codon:yes stop_codon:yes gene_type:complete
MRKDWETLEDLIAHIINHSTDHDAVDKAEDAYTLIEKLRGAK